MNTISPLDNRYSEKINDVICHFSDYNFTKYKFTIELDYLKYFLDAISINYSIKNLYFEYNKNIYNNIQIEELNTNHDVAALVNVIKQNIHSDYHKWVHFGLTSQDINSPAMMIMYKEYIYTILFIDIIKIETKINKIKADYGNIDILSFTHGQPATPIQIIDIFNVYSTKINNIVNDIDNYQWTTKMGGSNGKLSALNKVFPNINWCELLEKLLDKYKLKRNKYTTQVDDYSNYYKLFQILERLCYILINITQDIWQYCSKEYFKLKNVNGEVGSSAMPHKINPIQFENAEGNLKIASALFHTIGSNITICRLQRDLTDSTMLRNIGVACGHLTLAMRNMINGFDRIQPNLDIIKKDLENNSCILMETIQLLFRKWDISDGYDICKEYSRGSRSLNMDHFLTFIREKNINLTDEQVDIIKNI
tara:strand:+ start:11211 stop:12479 length:1269 start_codon:yes stop_codon:yes gene_type:complete